jgi:Lrp/AsnC family transcriptional regulator for asnA, asnC and gidA
MVGVSESQIRKRYARLVDHGSVQVLAITNPRILGYKVSAWVAIRISPDLTVTEIANLLATFSSVSYLAICAGRYDIMVEVICRDKDDLYALLETKLRKVSGVTSVETFICSDFFYRKISPLNDS